MRLFKIILFKILLCFSLTVYSHNPEDLVIAEIEQGQLTFENETIDAEYNAALKRLRMRRLGAMSFEKKFTIFTKAGFEHIIPKGFDHIVFVLGLFFSCLHFRALLLQVTAFTVAHSITLAFASIGLIKIPGSIVEPLIALSIVWIAIENCVFKKPTNWRYLVVFSFGLLHGLGFASVLSYYGLPKENFISLLLAFNIGVELGQLSILILAFLLMNLLLTKRFQMDKVRFVSSIIIGAIGLFWLIERVTIT
ncbi:MAG: hypothetical protein CMP50_06975 [Flavobacteriales bacterium]|nr:hypothetical protein [Flavobacteriales bacterium]|tara:strand:- start:639 stop:1391 length:753 start_codon:yes stop_codon:yes gene_type:complete